MHVQIYFQEVVKVAQQIDVAAIEKLALELKALRSAFEKLIGRSDLLQRLGEAARRLCAGNFSYERILDGMEKIYREVSGRR